MADEKGVFPRFFKKAVADQIATEKEGRPIFKEIEMVEITSAGNPYSIPHMVVTDEHRQRWPEHYKQFKAGQDRQISGTPLSQWPMISLAEVEGLAALKIFSVEDLADLNDLGLQRLGMGGRELQAKARAYLKAAKDFASVHAEAKAREQIEQRFAEQTKTMNEMRGIIEAQTAALKAAGLNLPNLADVRPIEAEAPKRRGRPPKSQAA